MDWVHFMEWMLLLAGFTLLHVTWQAFVAGAAVALMQRMGPRLSPRLRYAVSYALFLSLPVFATVTSWLLASSRSGVVLTVATESPR